MPPAQQATNPPLTRALAPVIWLDLLPLDASTRVARILSHIHSREHTFNLALSTRHQALAVSTALNKTYIIHSDAFSSSRLVQRQRKVAAAFRPHLINLQVYCKSVDPYCGRLLFSAPGLRSVTVPGKNDVLRYLAYAKHLEALSIDVDHTVSRPLLFRVFNSASIRKLTFTCTSANVLTCFFHNYRRNGISIPDLASVCTTLSDLTVMCGCDEFYHKLWFFAISCPNIRDLTVRMTPPERMLQFLQNLNSINYVYGFGNIEEAAKPSTIVRCLSWCDEIIPCNPRDLLFITNCTHLRKLDITIDNRVDILLASLIHKLPELEELGLYWRGQFNSGNYGDYKMRFDDNGPMSDPSPIALVSIMEQAYNVKAINIRGVRLRTDEVRAVLRLMGPRLEELTLSIHEQSEPMLNRLENILCLIVQFNGQLKMLHIRGLDRLEQVTRCLSEAVTELHTLARIRRLLKHLASESKIENLTELEDEVVKFFELRMQMYKDGCGV